MQAITFHAINRETVQTAGQTVQSVCESTHESPQGEGQFLVEATVSLLQIREGFQGHFWRK